ncbi:MAG TPA: ABC transporter ATP-binding protein [Beijerinckiaceae bacterium]|nr:ABC transporter ATP-binding protein [Beijerinckiaceae bacterium]
MALESQNNVEAGGSGALAEAEKPNGEPPLIEVESLSKNFGSIVAVDRISFALRRGEVLGFLGPNGAGKSTTMRMITGYLPASAGRVRICGADIENDANAAKRRIGYLPEGAPLYSDMSPEAFLNFVASVRGLGGAQRARRVADVIAQLQLGEVLHRRIDTLSKGFKRRVGLAQALVHDPDVLILDEPTDGLDPNQKHTVRQLIHAIGASKAIIVSTHLLEEVDAICARTIVIDHGRIVGGGTPEELRRLAPDHNAVILRVDRRDGARAADLLRADAALASVDMMDEGDAAELHIVPAKGASIADLVAAKLRDNGIAFHDFRTESGKLDEVFRKLTLRAAA